MFKDYASPEIILLRAKYFISFPFLSNMTNPDESSQQKPSSSGQQPVGKNSPRNALGAQERTAQNESNVNQSEKSSDEGDNTKMSQSGDDQEKIGQHRTNVTETEGSGGDNAKGQCFPVDLENVTQTDHGHEDSSGGATRGGSSSSNPGRKRGRQGGPIDVGSSSGSKAKKKGELDVPTSAPTCYVCKKGFASWKAVFGHLRAHRRQTPGAFPPPTFTPEGSPERNNGDKALREQLAPTLLNLARETMQKMNEDSNASTAAAADVGPSLRRGLDIDLNEPRTSVLLDQNDDDDNENDDKN